MNTRVKVARSMVWTSLESFGVSGLSIIGLIVVARYISPAEMGVAAMAQGIVQLLNIPVEFLFLDALIRQKDAEQIDFDTAHTVSALMGLAISLFCWLCSGSIAGLLHVPEMAPVLSSMGLSIAFMGFGAVIVARQRRDMEFRVLAMRSFAGRFGGVTVGIIVALMGGGVWSLVAQQVLMVAFATGVLWLQASVRPHFNFSYVHFKRLVSFGSRTIASAWLNLSVQRIFTLLVGAFLNTSAAGYLNLAFRIVDILRDIVVNAVVQLALPMFSRHSDDTEHMKKIYRIAVSFTCAVTFPLFAGLGLCAPDFIRIVFGEQWDNAVPYIAMLSFLSLIYFSRLYSNSILAARGFPQLPLLPDCAALIMVVACMLLLNVSGQMTLALAAAIWALRYTVSLPIDVRNIRKVLGIRFREQMEGALVPFAGVAMMAVSLLCVKALLLSGLTPLPRVIIMAVVGGTVYAVTLWTLDKARIKDLWQFALTALKGREPEPQVQPQA